VRYSGSFTEIILLDSGVVNKLGQRMKAKLQHDFAAMGLCDSELCGQRLI
jgi:hypothetical protein